MEERTRRGAQGELVLDLGDAGGAGVDRRVLLAALVAGGLALGALVLHLATAGRTRFATQPARVGELVVTVTATGTLEPIDEVAVGSELSGTLRSVEVEPNAHVSAGQVLARLDTTRLSAQVLESQAALDAAKAAEQQASASLGEAEGQLARFERARALSAGKVPSEQELADGRSAVARARAVSASAAAQVAQATATLDAQRGELSKAEIRSPIDGMVLSSAARTGQTVAASLQAPVLFTLARDLEHLELALAVDEADVGKVSEGQLARFEVDAWPGETFDGRVRQVRFDAHASGGVVSYDAIVTVDNPGLRLRPGMTATAEIEIAREPDALLIPNAALRFEPGGRGKGSTQGLTALLEHPHAFDRSGGGPAEEPHVWTLRDGRLERQAVEPGASDGSWTRIASGAIAPGTPIVVASAGDRG